MEPTSVIGTLILLFTGLFTYQGLRNPEYFITYCFDVDKILVDKSYQRLFTSGFLHANWLHFGFNMIGLMSFSMSLELLFGLGKFALLYFSSLLGGNLLSLWIHRNHGDYRAVGASGAVSGVIFSSIILFPDHPISFVIIPLEIKSWILGLLFLAISILGIKKQKDNIGHEAHLGGAITGALLTLVMYPEVIKSNWWIVLALLLPSFAFLLLLFRNPAVLLVEDYWGETLRKSESKSPKVLSRREKQEELDVLLDKIRHKGMNQLSRKEKNRLDELTKEL